MAVLDEIRKEADARFIDLLANLKAEREKDPEDKDLKKIAELGKEITELNAQYGFDEDVVSLNAPASDPSKTIGDLAEEKSQALISAYRNVSNEKKKENLMAKYKEFYLARRKAEAEKNQPEIQSNQSEIDTIVSDIATITGESEDDVRKVEETFERDFKIDYEPSKSGARFFKKRTTINQESTEYDELRTKYGEQHRIKRVEKYNKYNKASRFVLNALSAAACTIGIMAGAGITLTAPYLPTIGAIAFASLLGAEGNRRIVSRMVYGRKVTLHNIYEDRLKKANLKLEKIEAKAKAKFNPKTGKYSSFYENKINKQKQNINGIKHKIVKVDKRGPLDADIKATALQISLAILLANFAGPALAGQVAVGLLSFISINIVNKIKKSLFNK